MTPRSTALRDGPGDRVTIELRKPIPILEARRRQLSDCEHVLEEGRRMLAELRSDCREQSLAATFSGGFAACKLKIDDPCERVDSWTREASDAISALATDDAHDLSAIPPRARKPLESDSSYGARCLKERLAALVRVISADAARG